MRKPFIHENTVFATVGIILFVTPILVYLYSFWLAIKLFLIPAFSLYFSLYGVAGTFMIWIGLSLVGFISAFSFFYLLSKAK